MRVLVFGAGGQLGRELVGLGVVGLTRAECDVTRPGSAAEALRRLAPDAVINCAGWTRVDAAEADRDGAFMVNETGARLVAEACSDAGVLLCHISTDYVFDGTASSPIAEDTAPKPLNVYGASKLAGERAVQTAAPRHQIVRTAWLYGQDGPNFVLTILRLAAERDELRVVDDQRGAPTWTGHLAPAVIRLLEHGRTGTYHLTNGGETTWKGFATTIVAAAGLHPTVVPISTAELAAPAPRPAYSVLDNHAWSALGEAPLPHWERGLYAYLHLRGIARSGSHAIIKRRIGGHRD